MLSHTPKRVIHQLMQHRVCNGLAKICRDSRRLDTGNWRRDSSAYVTVTHPACRAYCVRLHFARLLWLLVHVLLGFHISRLCTLFWSREHNFRLFISANCVHFFKLHISRLCTLLWSHLHNFGLFLLLVCQLILNVSDNVMCVFCIRPKVLNTDWDFTKKRKEENTKK